MIFENWILQPGYPDIVKSSNGNTAVIKFRAKKEDIPEGQPELDSAFPSDLYDDPDLYDVELKNIHINFERGSSYAHIQLNYADSDSNYSGSKASYTESKPQHTMSGANIDIAIEKHPKYKTNWNYHLIKKTGTSEAAPEGWATATDTKITGKNDWKWVKDSSEVPENWEISSSKTKPGVEAYPIAAPIVHEKIPYRSKASANKAAQAVNVRRAPSETFGLSTSSDKWLKLCPSVYYEDRYWVVQTDYQYADNVDSEIYD